jgi:hypothetical protein
MGGWWHIHIDEHASVLYARINIVQMIRGHEKDHMGSIHQCLEGRFGCVCEQICFIQNDVVKATCVEGNEACSVLDGVD